MGDMASTIVPKSDQLNSDDLIAGPITIRITGVDIRGGQEQPISIHYEGDAGKPYKPCKSMCRVMVTAWGSDSKAYVGRSMTLYRDPAVKWAGMEVGGIRISHMSDIEDSMTMALTVTRSNRKPFTVKPLPANQRAAGASPSATSTRATEPGTVERAGSPTYITPDEVIDLEAMCFDAGISTDKLKKAANVNSIAMILAADHARAVEWIHKAAAKVKS